jgi:hypothetical protein
LCNDCVTARSCVTCPAARLCGFCRRTKVLVDHAKCHGQIAQSASGPHPKTNRVDNGNGCRNSFVRLGSGPAV